MRTFLLVLFVVLVPGAVETIDNNLPHKEVRIEKKAEAQKAELPFLAEAESGGCSAGQCSLNKRH